MVLSLFSIELFYGRINWEPEVLGLALGSWLLVEERPWPREVIFMDWALAPEVYWVYERLKAKG
jgi:hypothetical protein